MKTLTAAVIAASLLCIAPLTRAVTIDFGNTNDLFFAPAETYTEDNFRFTVVSGNEWAIPASEGNPPSALVAGFDEPIGNGETISVMQLGGGLFSFTAFDFASATDGSPSDGVDLIGLVNGVQTHIFPNVNSSSSSFTTQDPLFLTSIDELRIVGASQAVAALVLDNFVFNPTAAAVPEGGSSVLLMALALTALLVTRRLLSGRNKLAARALTLGS